MKLVSGSRSAEHSRMHRFNLAITSLLAALGFKKKPQPTPSQRYERAIESSTITPDQRRTALANAAADPGLTPALDEADRAYEQYVKGLESGELHAPSITPSSSGR